jgi:RNA polymerase sigma-70 factor (ECF subfamily)
MVHASARALCNAQLYDTHADEVHRVVWRILGADPEHDDLVHQIFVRAFDKVHDLRDPKAVRGWLLRIAVNTVRSELRRRRIRRLLGWDGGEDVEVEVGAWADPQGLDPEHWASAKLALRLLDRLRAQDRIAYMLRFGEGRTIPEVASACGCSVATVHRRLTRAQDRLETLMSGGATLVLAASQQTGECHAR